MVRVQPRSQTIKAITKLAIAFYNWGMKYIIRKSSRDTLQPYSGASCAISGVPEGKVYEDRKEAMADAAKLSKVNPVGFEVHEITAT